MKAGLFLAMMIGSICLASGADARLWPWPQDFEEVEGRWLGDRFITEEEGDSLAKQDLCFDCHDGSVQDHRELWDSALHGHRAGVEPKSPLPEGIPLVAGRLYCGSCHLPHGGLPGTRKEVEKPYLRYDNTNDVFCVACHQERATPGGQEVSLNHSFLKKARKDTSTADPKAWEEVRALGGRMGKDGATRCQSCHRSHGAPATSSLIAPVDRSQLCSVCHHDIRDDRLTSNHPLHGKNAWKVEGRPATVECLTCHRVHEAPVKGVLLAEEGEALCLRCHQENRLAEQDRHRDRKLLDGMREASGEIRSGLCGACHKTHRAKGPFLAGWVGGREELDPDSRFCSGCHETMKGMAEKRIGPESHFVGAWPERPASGAKRPSSEALPLLTRAGKLPAREKQEVGEALGCRTCHFMHHAPDGVPPDCVASSLRRPVSEGDLCLACHRDRKPILETGHNPLRIEKAALRERFPLKQGNPCSACHAVHQARTPNLYPTPRFPGPDTDAASAACLDCHGTGTEKAETRVGPFSHPIGPWPGDTEETAKDLSLPESLPLIPRDSQASTVGTAGQAGSVSCNTCHQLHSTGEPKRAPDKDLRPPLKQAEACVVCHRGQKAVMKTKHFIRDPKLEGEIERLFGKGEESHECTPCHRVHNAKGAGLWFSPLPAPKNTFEQDERSRRCLTCHLHDSFKKIRETGGHPIGEPMKTQYLPSEEARLTLGRIAPDPSGLRDVLVCATCHLNHGTEHPDGSVGLFAGGGLPEGDLCIACHRENRRIVGSPHDFRTRKEGEFLPDDGRSRQFGVCAGCHANHDANIHQGLLAFKVSRPKGKGNPEDMFCLHCHRDERIMKGRPVRFYVHPSGPEVRKKLQERQKEKRPAAGQKLGEPARTSQKGYEAIFQIRCVTCHDNHRWSSLSPEEATDLSKTEMTSFLRGSGVAEALCANCHGVDALYRYRYFHQDRAFQAKTPNE